VGYCTHLTGLNIHKKQRLDEVLKYMESLPMGGTNCALPWIVALKERHKLDAVISYTDNETWVGSYSGGNAWGWGGTTKGHVFQWVDRYRNEMHRPTARSVVVATTATGFTLNDPKDRYGLDVVGFDTAVPEVISQFIRGE